MNEEFCRIIEHLLSCFGSSPAILDPFWQIRYVNCKHREKWPKLVGETVTWPATKSQRHEISIFFTSIWQSASRFWRRETRSNQAMMMTFTNVISRDHECCVTRIRERVNGLILTFFSIRSFNKLISQVHPRILWHWSVVLAGNHMGHAIQVFCWREVVWIGNESTIWDTSTMKR